VSPDHVLEHLLVGLEEQAIFRTTGVGPRQGDVRQARNRDWDIPKLEKLALCPHGLEVEVTHHEREIDE
jgi:hypothetical protein